MLNHGMAGWFYKYGLKRLVYFERYDDIREASRRPDVFSNHSIVATDPEPAYRFLPSFVDPPQHIKYRKLMNWWFAPAEVQKM